MKDIRLYTYKNSNLKKLEGTKFHKHKDVESAVDIVNIKRGNKYFGKFAKREQFVIIDYTDKPGGIIVAIIDPVEDDHAKTTQMGQDL